MLIDQGMSDFDQKTVISRILSELKYIIQADRIPNALLFSGRKSTGKKETAIEFAKTCNCRADSKRPCNDCLSCKKIDAGMHPDIIQVSLAEKKDDFNSFKHKAELESFLSEKFGYDHNRLLTDHSARWIVNLYFFKQLEDVLNAE